jgi:hypothetical protein
MRTKTLLAAAAAFALSLAASQATPVFSANVVGYVNTPLTANTLTVVSPCLDVDGTGLNNLITNVFPNPTIGDVAYVFNGAGYDNLNYIGGRGAPFTGWSLNNVNVGGTYKLNPGVSVFYLPVATETNTQVGIVLQSATLTNSYVAAANGISLVGSMAPLAGGVTTVLQYAPTIGDVIYIYNGAGYDNYNYIGGRGAPFTGWSLNNVEVEPVIPLAGGFWLQPVSSTPWVQNFIVQ